MLNLYKYPSVVKLMKACEREVWAMRAESMKMELREWPEKINNGGWKVGGATRWQGRDLKNAPQAAKLIVDQFSDLIVNAGYSVLEPGARITPHVGYTDQVLRFHFGLSCPRGDCQISINGYHYRWSVGEAMLFDDTVIHWAWNNTEFRRVILLLDLRKDELDVEASREP